METLRLKVFHERCTGCRTCEIFCSWANLQELNPRKAAIRIRASFPVPGRYSVVVCDQCGACIDLCPAGALERRGEVVVLDRAKCTNCGACREGCPSGAVFAHPDLPSPLKCELCGECARVCAAGALILEGEVGAGVRVCG